MASIRQAAITGVKWSSLSMGITVSLQFITLAVLARFLEPSDFGLMGMVLIVTGFVRLYSDLGISNAIIHRKENSADTLSSLYWLNILVGVLLFLLINLLLPLIIDFYNEPKLAGILFLASFSFLIIPWGNQFQVLMQKELKFNLLAKNDVLGAVSNSLVSIALAMSGFGVFSLVWGQLTSLITRTIVLCIFGVKIWVPSFTFSFNKLRGYISFGLYQLGEKSITFFNTNIDYLLIAKLLGAEALGYYSLAYNLIIRPTTLINPLVNKVAFPIFAKVQNDLEKLKYGYLKVIKYLSTVNFPLMVGLFVTAPVCTPLIFGDQWEKSIILIQILSIVGLLRSVGNPISTLMLARGRADLGFKWNASISIIHFAGLFIGIHLGGIIGAATAFAILQCNYALGNYFILIRNLVGSCLKEYISHLWPSFWMSTLMGLLVFILSSAINIESQAILFGCQLIVGITFFGWLVYVYNQTLVHELKGLLFPPSPS